MPGNSRGALVEEALPQNLFATWTPLDPLSCHARRARGTASLPVRPLAAERRGRGTPARSRKLTCRGQALLALRWFRDRTRPGRLAADHGISRAIAYRYIDEAVDVLSAPGPGPRPGPGRRQSRKVSASSAGRNQVHRSRVKISGKVDCRSHVLSACAS